MLDALYFYFRGVADALEILLNLDIPLTDGVSIKFYWIVFLIFSIYIFIRVSAYYLKGVPDGNSK